MVISELFVYLIFHSLSLLLFFPLNMKDASGYKLACSRVTIMGEQLKVLYVRNWPIFDGAKITLNMFIACEDMLTLRNLCTQPRRFCIVLVLVGGQS